MIESLPLKKLLLMVYCLLCVSSLAWAENDQYQVEINAPSAIKSLLQTHLDMMKWRDNPRISPAEWQRLYAIAPQNIKELLATEAYFSPSIQSTLTHENNVHLAKFSVEVGQPAIVEQVDIRFTGDITTLDPTLKPNINQLRENWLLKTGQVFRQSDWSEAKQKLLAGVVVERYPNASVTSSKAEVNPDTHTVSLQIAIDSGPEVRFGETSIEGLKGYNASVIEHLNSIKPARIYKQSELLTFQTRLQESGYFASVEVTADTQNTSQTNPPNVAPIKVTVVENRRIKMEVGAGYSTNLGPRAQLTVTDLSLFNMDWRLTSNLKVDRFTQTLTNEVKLPTTKAGYRDSITANAAHASIENVNLTIAQAGVKRAWGSRKREQYVTANVLVENSSIDNADVENLHTATLGYGITLRKTDHDINPTLGYLLNLQFTGAPITSNNNSFFLQIHLRVQGYYPISKSTQLITRAEIGLVNGKNQAPELFKFRAGGDQSVRGYSFQSLGVTVGDATAGGRYLATGSVEIVQWLTSQWGAAFFVDAGNAADTLKDLEPVYGYGMGARWKSPLGPIGADIAYGAEVDEYRLHFNIGLAF
jgi:translocation and assembly module TamA